MKCIKDVNILLLNRTFDIPIMFVFLPDFLQLTPSVLLQIHRYHSASSSMSITSRKVLTLVIIRRGTEILLGMKKRGFGAGKWNGFGGKLESGETLLEGAKR